VNLTTRQGQPICHRRWQRGASVIELSAVLAISAVLAAVAMPSFTEWQANSRIRAVAETLNAGVQITRAEAVTRNTSVRLTIQGNGSYSIACVDTTVPGCSQPLYVRNGNEADGAVLQTITELDGGTSTTTARSIVFDSRGMPDSDADRIRTIEVDVPAASLDPSRTRELRLNITDFGQSRLCDPNVAAGDPRAC
jgi:type IV fimbrial biogenesis protein FimT